uniref:F-box domain-containing protein n=1 Tax=Ditylenchus dipsaci TaxID=166011 RepID=A0A915E930_9BILA
MSAVSKFSDDNLLDTLRFLDRRELELFSCLNRKSNLLVKRNFAHYPLRLLDSLKFHPNDKWSIKGKVCGWSYSAPKPRNFTWVEFVCNLRPYLMQPYMRFRACTFFISSNDEGIIAFLEAIRPLGHLWTDRSLKIEIDLDPNCGELTKHYKIGLSSYNHLFLTNFLSNCKNFLISIDANDRGECNWPDLPLATSDLKNCSSIYLKQNWCLKRVKICEILDYLFLGY